MAENQVEVHATRPDEAKDILALTRATGVFTAEEEATVDELLTEYLRNGAETSGYYFLSGCLGSVVAGFACYGPHPLTEATWDLYWIAVGPERQSQGLGNALLEATVQHVQTLGARLLLAETSSTPAYLPARRFYETHGFSGNAVVPGFYAPDDDLVIYYRRL